MQIIISSVSLAIFSRPRICTIICFRWMGLTAFMGSLVDLRPTVNRIAAHKFFLLNNCYIISIFSQIMY